MMNLYLKVENLRSIRSMGYVELKPITILVGKNNSGKSTFLKTFQLLRRSIETLNCAPVLWQGHPVDYGDYTSAVTDNLTDQKIAFCFKMENVKLEHNDLIRNIKKMEYKVFLVSIDNRTFLNKIEFILDDYDICVSVDFSNDGTTIKSFKINGSTLTNENEILSNYKIIVDINEIFPSFNVVPENYPEFKERFSSIFRHTIYTSLQQFLVDYNIHEGVSNNLFLEFINDLLENPIISTEFLCNKIENKKINVEYYEMYSKIAKNQELIDNINKYCLTYWSFKSINSASGILREFLAKNIYIGPERISSQRNYVVQEIDTSNISHDGSNFPMFLDSLSDSALLEFVQWIESLLAVKLQYQKNNNLVRIFFERKNINMVNLIDSGYGLSQILPVFAQFWITSKKCSEFEDIQPENGNKRLNDNILPITIEQPEVHLHPAHQEKITEALAEATNVRRLNFSPIFIIETHSKKIIDKLSVLIKTGEIDRKIVNIILFSTKESSNSFRESSESDDIYSHIYESNFNVTGRLENWPYGFLR